MRVGIGLRIRSSRPVPRPSPSVRVRCRRVFPTCLSARWIMPSVRLDMADSRKAPAIGARLGSGYWGRYVSETMLSDSKPPFLEIQENQSDSKGLGVIERDRKRVSRLVMSRSRREPLPAPPNWTISGRRPFDEPGGL